MFYQPQLDFLTHILTKMNLQVQLFDPEKLPQQRLDLGLRKFMGLDDLYERADIQKNQKLHANTVYRLVDEFLCNYILLFLPQQDGRVFLVGPFLSFEKTRTQILEEAERFRVPANRISQLENCYASIPVLQDDTALFAMINSFAELLWGTGNAYEILSIQYRSADSEAMLQHQSDADPEEILLQISAMEKRYAYENELIETVSRGMRYRAEHMINNFTMLALQQRTSDPIRDLKNYCIICNTLLRKAAERGGVHPIHLDSSSSTLAKKVEQITQFDDGVSLMREMVRTYCRLVKKHTVQQYSPLIQRTISYIESNLSGDLRLHVLASLQNVSDSYLSALFHRENGTTITEYVSERRMEIAAELLLTTHLQIQTVAQHCGITDVNYFSKVFKKHHGLTPKQYRESGRPYSK